MRSRQFLAMNAVCSGVGSIFSSPWSARFHPGRVVDVGFRGPLQANEKLLAVELDDELLADRQGHVLARRQLDDRATEVLLVELDPLRHAAAVDRSERLVDARDLLRRLANLDHVARTDEVRRDVDLLAVDREVAVAHELARLGVIAREAHAVGDVVEAALEELDQGVTRDARGLEGLVVVAAELALGDAVDALDLLLLAELLAVVRPLAAAVLAVLTRRIATTLVAALVRVATLSLEEELHVFAPAEPTNCTRIASHLLLCPSER